MFFQLMGLYGITANEFENQNPRRHPRRSNFFVNEYGDISNPKRSAKRARNEANKKRRQEEQEIEDARVQERAAQLASAREFVYEGR